MLTYASRRAFVNGMDDIVGRPVLTMAQECSREWRFRDWKSCEYSLRSEWDYVVGRAEAQAGCTAGTRDVRNGGKTPEDFLAEANALIAERREAEEGQYGRDGLQQAVVIDAGERRRRRPGRAAGGGDARGGQVVRCDPRRARVRVVCFPS